MSDLARTTLAIEQELLEKFDSWMASHGYQNRSQAMRDLVRAALVEEQWANPQAAVIAVLSIVYDHQSRSLAQDLTDLQHADHHAILCSQHVHLDHDLCLEVILMQGTAQQLRRISDGIVATKGMRAAKLSLMSKDV